MGAVAKGIRRTKSRFGGRLEPLSHVELMLHQGSGELATVTGASLMRPHSEAREDSYRLAVGSGRARGDAPALHRAGAEPARLRGAARGSSTSWTAPRRAATEPPLDPLVLSFQLKLLWLSGYLPHLTSCAECGCRRAARRLFAAGRRSGLRALRSRLAPALGRGHRGDRGPPRDAARRRGDLEARRPRGAARDHVVVRVPRRVPPPHRGRPRLGKPGHVRCQAPGQGYA